MPRPKKERPHLSQEFRLHMLVFDLIEVMKEELRLIQILDAALREAKKAPTRPPRRRRAPAIK